MPDETEQGNNSLNEQNKEMQRQSRSEERETKERRGGRGRHRKEDKDLCSEEAFVRDAILARASG